MLTAAARELIELGVGRAGEPPLGSQEEEEGEEEEHVISSVYPDLPPQQLEGFFWDQGRGIVTGDAE